MYMRIIGIITAIGAALIFLIVGAYCYVSVVKLMAGNTSESIVIVAYLMFMAILAVVFMSMVNEVKSLDAKSLSRESKPASVSRKSIKAIKEQLYLLVAGNTSEKFAVLDTIDRTFTADHTVPTFIVNALIDSLEQENDENLRRQVTSLLLRAAHMSFQKTFNFADPKIVNFLRLRLVLEPAHDIRQAIYQGFGQLYTRYDSPGGPINVRLGKTVVASLLHSFQQELDEQSRVQAFTALTRLWCLDQETSEPIVRAATHDKNAEIRELATDAIDYAFNPDY